MSTLEFDPRAFGRLEQSVETLSANVTLLTGAVNELTARISEIENRYHIGKSGLIGLLIGLTLSIYGASELLDKLLGALAR